LEHSLTWPYCLILGRDSRESNGDCEFEFRFNLGLGKFVQSWLLRVPKTPATGTEEQSFARQGEGIGQWKTPILIEEFILG
jgi:hypothetical protein